MPSNCGGVLALAFSGKISYRGNKNSTLTFTFWRWHFNTVGWVKGYGRPKWRYAQRHGCHFPDWTNSGTFRERNPQIFSITSRHRNKLDKNNRITDCGGENPIFRRRARKLANFPLSARSSAGCLRISPLITVSRFSGKKWKKSGKANDKMKPKSEQLWLPIITRTQYMMSPISRDTTTFSHISTVFTTKHEHGTITPFNYDSITNTKRRYDAP